MAIYQQIARYLDENGKKQIWLSRKTGIRQPTLSDILNGKRKISVEEYMAICQALGVDERYFNGKRKKGEKNEKEIVLTSAEGNN